MNRLAVIMIAFVAVIPLLGCFSARTQTDKALKRVEQADRKAATNRTEQLTKAAALVHGTGRALAAETNRTPAVSLAYDLNSRAGSVLGAPRYEDGLAMENIVRGALSPLMEEQQRSAAALAKIDGQVTSLQRRMDGIQGDKGRAEDARDDRMVSLAAEADFGRKIRRWLWIGGIGVVGLFVAPFVLQVISVAFPAAAPLTAIASGIVALPGRFLMRAVPAAADAAGVVRREIHQEVDNASVAMTAAIRRMKEKNPAEFEALLKPHLLAATNTDTQTTIDALKRRAPLLKS